MIAGAAQLRSEIEYCTPARLGKECRLAFLKGSNDPRSYTESATAQAGTTETEDDSRS